MPQSNLRKKDLARGSKQVVHNGVGSIDNSQAWWLVQDAYITFYQRAVGLCSKLPKPYRDVLPLARLHLLKASITSQNSATDWGPSLQIHECEGGLVKLLSHFSHRKYLHCVL